MLSLRSLGLAAAISSLPACQKPAEQPRQEVVSACERLRTAIGAEVAIESVIEQRASGQALAKAAWDDAHVESMAAAAALPKEDQVACLREIKESK